MKLIYINRIVLACLILLSLSSCDPWDDHVKDSTGRSSESVMQAILAKQELSVFAGILQKTGYDALLSGDRKVTVFAPVNESLTGIDLSDNAALLKLVRNHIAYQEYTVYEGSFTADSVEMINTKRLPLKALSVGGVNLSADAYNICVGNGMLHAIVSPIHLRLNIWEYLKEQTGYPQVDFLKAITFEEMDMENSIQIGFDAQGNPVYDTVKITRNLLLEKYPINKEGGNHTFILLDATTLNRIESKYSKYFKRPTQEQQDSLVRAELIKDCILFPVKINAAGRYYSQDSVLIDIDPAAIREEYQASNGVVYKLSDAEVKVYENKLKTILIEAENYAHYWADGDAWTHRNRSHASGGVDMMMNGTTRYVVRYNVVDEQGIPYPDSTATATFDVNCFTGTANNGYIARESNCYIAYKQVMHSVPYQIRWAAYDDMDIHITSTKEHWQPIRFSQKMLFSFPDTPELTRTASVIHNHFSTNTVFSSDRFTAGQKDEFQLRRYTVSTTTANTGLYILEENPSSTSESDFYNVFTGTDEYGDKDQLICPRYGESTIFVANTTVNKSTVSGMIFLDYIKLIPLVDIND